MTTTTWRMAAMLALTFAALGATACSKNEAATSACSAMQDTTTCSACCSSNGASGHKIATGSSCTCLGGSGGAAKAPAAPNAKSAAGTASFAGTYKTNWGPTTFTQNGAAIAATYPKGTMTCQPTGNTLDCDWKEGAAAGKAKLTKEADGSLKGTWGNGASNTNGGAWVFTL